MTRIVHNYAALLTTSAHMGQQIAVHLSLLCGLRTGEVDQSCLTDVLSGSINGNGDHSAAVLSWAPRDDRGIIVTVNCFSVNPLVFFYF